MGKEKKEKKAKKEKQSEEKLAKAEKVKKPEKSSKKESAKEPKLPKVKPAPAKIIEPEEDDSFDAMDFVTTKVGGRWKMKVLYALRDKSSKRYSEIKSKVPGITDMMLSSSLRDLVADGLVDRKQFSEVPLRVEYQISDFGYQLTPALIEMVRWAIANKNA